jgi:hypothetical protein
MHVASITASTDNGTMGGIRPASRSLMNYVNRMIEKAGHPLFSSTHFVNIGPVPLFASGPVPLFGPHTCSCLT